MKSDCLFKRRLKMRWRVRTAAIIFSFHKDRHKGKVICAYRHMQGGMVEKVKEQYSDGQGEKGTCSNEHPTYP